MLISSAPTRINGCLGPNGTAVLWSRGDVLEKMRPQILGWLAVAGRDNWLAYDTTPIAGAERFEPGARNYLGVVATEASLALLQEFGMANVEKRVVELRDYAAQKLEEIGCQLLWNPTPQSQRRRRHVSAAARRYYGAV